MFGYLRALREADGVLTAEEMIFTLQAEAGLTFCLMNGNGEITGVNAEYDVADGVYRIPYTEKGCLFAE